MIFIIKENNKLKNAFKNFLVFLFWILIWQIISKLINKEILFPTPGLVFLNLLKLILEKNFWIKVLNSLLKILIAYLSAIIVGSALGFLSSYFKIIDAVIAPIIKIIQSIPVPSITMLFLFYIKSKSLPTIVSFIIVMPIIWQSVKSGFENIDIKNIEMAKIFDLSFKDKILNIYLPSVLPFLFSAMQSGIGLAWKAGIASEITAVPLNTIGGMIKDSKTYLDSKGIFSWTIVVIILSMLFSKVFTIIIDKISNLLRLKKVVE